MRRSSLVLLISIQALGTLIAALLLTANTWAAPKYKVLHNFGLRKDDGVVPYAPVIMGADGNVYGTTVGGGTDKYGGTVFELTRGSKGKWAEAIPYDFCGTAAVDTPPTQGLPSTCKGTYMALPRRAVLTRRAPSSS